MQSHTKTRSMYYGTTTKVTRSKDKGNKIERQQHRAEFKRRLAIRFTMLFQPNLFLPLSLN